MFPTVRASRSGTGSPERKPGSDASVSGDPGIPRPPGADSVDRGTLGRTSGMRVRNVFGALLLAALNVAGSTPEKPPMEPIGSISGAALRVIQAALPAWEGHGLQLERYTIAVYEGPSSYVVLF